MLLYSPMHAFTDYPFRGTCKIRYSQLQEGEDVRFRLGTAANCDHWFLRVFLRDQQLRCVVSTIPRHVNSRLCRSNSYIGLVNHQDSSVKVFGGQFETKGRADFNGALLNETEVLEELSEWLKDGKFTVLYGIYVEAFKETIWTFNFHQPAFRDWKTKHTICFEKKNDKSDRRYCHKQLMIHHSPTIAEDLSKNDFFVELEDCFEFDSLEKCLQIVHGARVTIRYKEVLKVLNMAHFFNLYTVIRYCEMELIQRKTKFIRNHIQIATNYKLSRYLASALREINSSEAIKEDFRHVDIGCMTGEMMKQCVMYLLKI
ncbi:unnamed protein product [Caenorhabditis brenneri]